MNQRASPPDVLPGDVTGLLVAWTSGNQDALAALVIIVYNELRRIARRHMPARGSEPPGQTLNTTALVHEAYLRLANQKETNWRNRAHFFAVSAQSMRHILVDMARARRTDRRGAGARKLSLDELVVFPPETARELVALDEALSALAKLDERKSRIVEMRFFGGLTLDETAEVLNISPETVSREWTRAKSWLRREMTGQKAVRWCEVLTVHAVASDMTLERYQKINSLVDTLLDLPRGERGPFLDQACADDSDLRDEVSLASLGTWIEKMRFLETRC